MPTQLTIQALIRDLSPKSVSGARSGQISGLVYDSRKIEPGCAFFALCGAGADGHTFIDTAVENGATVIVMEQEQVLPDGVSGLVVEDTRRALATASALWFGNPTQSMKVVGVTGTNGQTSSWRNFTGGHSRRTTVDWLSVIRSLSIGYCSILRMEKACRRLSNVRAG